MGYELVGQVWDPEGFAEYLREVDLSWARGVTMHHTGSPSLAARPNGLKAIHLRNLKHFYKNELGWSSGPHLFIDEDQIWGLSSLERRGVHSVSFNKHYIGIEVLGDYDRESPEEGRGLQCWTTAAKATASLFERGDWEINSNTLNGHRDDPRTSKSCPGSKVSMDEFRKNVANIRLETPASPTNPVIDDRAINPMVQKRIEAIEWQLKQLKELIT